MKYLYSEFSVNKLMLLRKADIEQLISTFLNYDYLLLWYKTSWMVEDSYIIESTNFALLSLFVLL